MTYEPPLRRAQRVFHLRRRHPSLARRLAPLVMAVALACATSRGGAHGPDGNAEGFEATHTSGLERACTPTGIEQCFNAIDDNCNGIIDEGCGEPTGMIQILAAWGDSPADIDLDLTTPAGLRIYESGRNRGGFRYERNCPKDACFGQNYESIVFEGSDPPHGTYTVRARLGDLGTASSPVRVRLGARIGSKAYSTNVQLTPTLDQATVTFEL